MIKVKLAAFVAAATLSLSAHAGYIQYNLSGARFDDGGSLSGYFVQNTDDKSIAHFYLWVTGGNFFAREFFGSGTTANIISASTFYGGAGPTNFAAYNDQDTIKYSIGLWFGPTNRPGLYYIAGFNDEQGENSHPPYYRTVTSGTVSEGVIDPYLLDALESGQQDVTHIVPTLVNAPGAVVVPEPGSLALMMLGIAGLFGAGRRKLAAR